MSEAKTCRKCGETKGLTGFNPNYNAADGYLPECKVCRYAALKNKRLEKILKQSENQVEADIAKFLKGLGWRRTRNHVGRFRTESGERVMIGTLGHPDWTYRRPLLRGICEILHVETKSSTGRASAVQLEAIASLNHLGEPALVASSLEEFTRWYGAQCFTADWRSIPTGASAQNQAVPA